MLQQRRERERDRAVVEGREMALQVVAATEAGGGAAQPLVQREEEPEAREGAEGIPSENREWVGREREGVMGRVTFQMRRRGTVTSRVKSLWATTC